MKKIIFFISIFIMSGIDNPISAQTLPWQATEAERFWVDSVYNSLTWEERIGQLMTVRANQPDKPYDERIESYIRRYNIGGVTFFRNKAREQLIQTNRWQQIAKTPLLISIDAEWGLAMRIPGTVSYPLQMTLGAVQDNNLIYEMGLQIAKQCQSMGIHMNFAPVADVNNNPENPVIGMRSFGDRITTVTEKAMAYANGLSDGKIIATAKHFPGHGDTKTDSHYALPVIFHSRAHLDSTELKPFNDMIKQGVEGIMVAHLQIPSLDSAAQTPSTLSPKIVTDLLRKELEFKGLIVTDGLDMKGVTSVQLPGMVELKALLAGNDVLLLPENVPLAITTILEEMKQNSYVQQRIEESCKRILHYKFHAGLNHYRPIVPETMENTLKQDHYYALANQLFEASVTLLRNQDVIIPLKKNDSRKALLTIGYDKASILKEQIEKSGIDIEAFQMPRNAEMTQISKLEQELKKFDEIIVSIENTNILSQRNFGIEKSAIELVNKLSQSKKIILNIFASPYALDLFDLNSNYKAIIIGYQDRAEAKKAVSAVLTGSKQAQGKLPVDLKSGFKAGTGLAVNIESPMQEMLPMTTIELPIKYIKKIDSIALEGIKKKAYPGCQVLAMMDGQMLYHKNFGYLTYDESEAVTDSSIYDLASLTKILASTLAVMKLYEDGKLSLDKSLGDYFPYLLDTDKSGIRLIDILAHQSGFDGWIPYYLQTITKEGFDSRIYSEKMSPEFPLRVADGLYINRTYKHKLFDEIAASRLKKKEYRYSDLGFYFIPEIIALTTNEEFDLYLDRVFYHPMGLKNILFRPLSRFSKNQIAPTENDLEFRKRQLRGTVHDQGAALMGGISGHAGLFGNATDVAMIMQMLLNKGQYKGMQLLKEETVDYFTTAHFTQNKNRRGIGFDKPPLDPKDKSRSIAMAASMQSYGHTGFTGTMAWADPNNGLVFVFVSNRVYPDAKINRLAQLDIRSNIHELLYEAVKEIKGSSAR